MHFSSHIVQSSLKAWYCIVGFGVNIVFLFTPVHISILFGLKVLNISLYPQFVNLKKHYLEVWRKCQELQLIAYLQDIRVNRKGLGVLFTQKTESQQYSWTVIFVRYESYLFPQLLLHPYPYPYPYPCPCPCQCLFHTHVHAHKYSYSIPIYIHMIMPIPYPYPYPRACHRLNK